METVTLTLHDLLLKVKAAIKDSCAETSWIIAEISEMKVNYSGHCYMELIEKDPESDAIKARARATIWSTVFRMLQPYFETTTHTKLGAGLKIMVKVNAEFHEVYGFSLNITDIDPTYTIGDIARKRLEIINRLKMEGVFDMNRELILPALPQKIAVISSQTAAGYGDFTDQLINNAYGYKFYVKLFPALMQGDEAEKSVIGALDRIFKYEHFFDVVVIIRGGGSRSDLGCFDSYWLACHICQFPIPVLTGIGHEQDESIADMVAHTCLKTPTAVAEFLLNIYRNEDSKINELTDALNENVTRILGDEKSILGHYSLLLKPLVKQQVNDKRSMIRIMGINLSSAVKRAVNINISMVEKRKYELLSRIRSLFTEQKHHLNSLGDRNNYLNPFNILQRGYSVTYYKGKVVKDPGLIGEDEILDTRLAGGMLKSKSIKK